MNTKNNKRRRASQEKIEKAFVILLQQKELSQITVSEICELTSLNRSTFYSNYVDTYDLADKIKTNLEADLKQIYAYEWETTTHSYNFLPLFIHIKNNQLFYLTYFKLDYMDTYKSIFYNPEVLKSLGDSDFLDYRIEFFKSGITAIIKKWLAGGCKETPEEINSILITEYFGRKKRA